MGLVLNRKRIPPINKAKNVKEPVVKKVTPGTEYVNHSGFLGNEADMRLHMKNLQDYLKENPGDMDIRVSLANLEEIFGKN